MFLQSGFGKSVPSHRPFARLGRLGEGVPVDLGTFGSVGILVGLHLTIDQNIFHSHLLKGRLARCPLQTYSVHHLQNDHRELS